MAHEVKYIDLDEWDFPDAIEVLNADEVHTQRRTYVPEKELERTKRRNDELQDLCYELLDNLMPEICDKAFWCRDKDWHKCEDYGCGNFTFVILARELGIEV